ncbi:hypothetical protein SCOR_29595 [Sulfidibacter corallicola]|uniref:Photosynthesis system II assembly factor Ycf48/Hcf136-like domain-containing protein n=1 Tax=Sulfidibacter corallicola TaxID=2818388 RepID=A0A8A4TLD3_SULCO|nr:hypothetical protein [Sulfidibacter corallicola]QTD50287.1 hypothetical protein J3U87_32280 [Sulfidibacter corallicola]
MNARIHGHRATDRSTQIPPATTSSAATSKPSNASRRLAGWMLLLAIALPCAAQWSRISTSLPIDEIVSRDGRLIAIFEEEDELSFKQGLISESVDGRTWLSLADTKAQPFQGLADNGQTLLATSQGTTWTSTDGREWRQTRTPFGHIDQPLWAFGKWWARADGRPASSEDGTSWTLSSGLPQDVTFHYLAYDEPYLLALGTDPLELNVGYRTRDGQQWEEADSPPVPRLDLLDFLTSEGGRFYLGGRNGILVTSEDGRDWQGIVTNTDQVLRDLAGHDGKWVAVGDQGVMRKSLDGLNWAPVSLAVTEDWHSVFWTGGQFIASTESGAIWLSAQGDNWVASPQTRSWQFEQVVAGDGVVLARDAMGRLLRTANGGPWQIVEDAPAQEDATLTRTSQHFAYLGDAWIALSPDGLQWQTAAFGSLPYRSIAQSATISVALDVEGSLWRRTGGGDWQRGPATPITAREVAWYGDRFLMFGSDGVATSGDGQSWTKILWLDLDETGFTPQQALCRNGDCVVTGTANGRVLVSRNGTDWSLRSLSREALTASLTASDAGFLVADTQGRLFSSADTLNWTRHDAALPTGIQAMAIDAGTMVAVDGRHALVLHPATFTPKTPTFSPHAVVPWVVNNTQWGSRVAIVNLGEMTGEAVLRAITGSGEEVERVVTLEPREVTTFQAGELFPELSGYALFIETADMPVHTSFLTFNLEAVSGGMSPSQTTAPPIASLASGAIFAYLPGDQIPALVLVVGEDRTELETPITLTLYGEAGAELASRDWTLKGNRPSAALLGDLFPDLDLPAHGSVKAVSDEGLPIAGITFVFNQMRQPSIARAIPVSE